MKKPTSIVPVDTNFGSVINTKSMEMNDPLHPSAHIGRVSPSPFLFTRIQAKVDAMQDVPQQIGWVSWTSIAVGLVLILFIISSNVFLARVSLTTIFLSSFDSPQEDDDNNIFSISLLFFILDSKTLVIYKTHRN
jgi:hypothetical protein